MSLIVGQYRVDVVDTGSFALDGGAMFGVVPKPLWERSYTTPDNRNRIPMVARCLLLRSDDYVILVDTGNALHMSSKLRDIYAVDDTVSSLDASLSSLGVSPASVTHVVLTHLHFDHAGGTVIPSGSGFRPRFASARHIVQEEHLRWAESPTEKDRASFFPETWRTLDEYQLLDVIDGDGEILPGLHVERLYGHTAAMQSVTVHDEHTPLLFAADLIPTGAHVPVSYGMGYDNEPLRTISEKKRLLPLAVEGNWTVVFEHDALRQAARIISSERGFSLGEEIVVTEQIIRSNDA
jgi:glyoxylase-like metal-dependent hydrolase (beta-lactamase superfamily II)